MIVNISANITHLGMHGLYRSIFNKVIEIRVVLLLYYLNKQVELQESILLIIMRS
jgi:hypothetical protein